MSYSLRILKDNPLAYWTLDGKASGYSPVTYTSGSISSASVSADILYDSVSNASGYFVSAKYFAPTIVVNSASSYSINSTSSSKLIIENTTNGFYSGFENECVSMEFWFAFDSSFDGSGYNKNSSSVTSYFKNNQLNILKLSTKNGDFGKIYFDYSTGTIRFTINGADSEAYYVINNMDSIFHIVATYKSGALSLIVNGDSGIPGSISKTNLFASNYKYSASPVKTYFVFEPSSLNTAKHFLINSFALYNYQLSKLQCNNHIKWATTDDFPLGNTSINNVSYFSENDNEASFLWKKEFSGTEFTKNSTVSDLIISGSGLSNNSTSSSGYWQTFIPVVTDPLNIVSSKITWNSIDNCTVQTSIDNGATWTEQTKDSTINYVYPETISGNINNVLLRVILNKNYDSSSYKQYFNNLKIYLYSNIDKKSNDNLYSLTPAVDASGYHPFINKTSNEKIITLANQFGLHFAPSSSSVAGYATLTKNDATRIFAGTEFWFKLHNLSNGQNYLLDSDNVGGQVPSAYIEGHNGHLRISGPTGFAVYINGASVTDNSFVVEPNTPYHLYMTFGTSGYSGTNLYINGKTNVGKHSHLTVGFINVWDTTITPSSASTRYNLYTSKKSISVTDTSSSSTYIFNGLSSDTASAYKIG